jgi:uncharacterized membrane protein YkgB
MAPLTRSRSRERGNVPTALDACYYAQRVSAALIVSAATQVSMQRRGYAWTPGVHSREQIEGWRLVTTVHIQRGGDLRIDLRGVARGGQGESDRFRAAETTKQEGRMMNTRAVTFGVREETASRIRALGRFVLRYGLALVVVWIGLMKFTQYEANGIEPLVARSPFLGWVYRIWTVRQFSAGLGVVEVAIGILIALRHWSPKACAIGSAGGIVMFLTTLSFLFSTPGWEPSLGGFPALSAHPGQFLLKDVVLLGAAIWSLGDALTNHDAGLARTRANRSEVDTEGGHLPPLGSELAPAPH